IPMLLDPSHMSGDAAQVPALMARIEELGLNGAMIEVHCDPKAALSDNAQQITPKELRDTLDPILSRFSLASLICPPEGVELNWLRAEIDELDETLLDSVARRMEVSRRIGTWKKAHGITPLQPERFQMVLDRLKAKGEKRNGTSVPATFVEQLWNIIHEQSLREQE
ncbi:MAG: bifunctional 3-deoxy-7-phosphoheptulonate synthase/chorismate mutase type II, partial [Paludibacteraceae bacterium]|nr:bifunctional 3-deoxy-7-phosphoheptulonate synthase/chorismate mutase type II [Paludibacteraceae bacterium]